MTQTEPTTPQTRAKRVALQNLRLAMPLIILGTLLYSYIALLRNVWQLYALVAILIALAATTFYGLSEAGKGHYQRGVLFFMFGLMTAGVIVSAIFSSVGLLIGFVLIVFVLQISSQTLSPQATFYMLLLSLGVAIMTAALDALSFPFQYEEYWIWPITLATSSIIILIYGVGIIRNFSSLALRTKLTLSFLTISFISILTIAIVSNYNAFTTLTENAGELLLGQASETQGRIDQFLIETRNILRVEAQLAEVIAFAELPDDERSGSLQEAQIRVMLATAASREPQKIFSYGLLDRNGLNIADTIPDRVGSSEADESYFKEAVATEGAFTSNIRVLGTVGQSEIYFSTPVRNIANEIVGVLRVGYDATIIHDIVNRTAGLAGPGSYGVLLDEHNIYLSHSTAPELRFRAIGSLSIDEVRALQSEQRLPLLPPDFLVLDRSELDTQLRQIDRTVTFATTDVSTDGEVNQAAAVKVVTKPWQVVFFQPESNFLQPVQRQTTSIALVVIFITALVTVIAVLVAQRLAAPIISLTEAAQEIAGGNLDVEVEVKADDEIGVLAAAFNGMVVQMRDVIGSLEQRVAERTRALQASIEVGRHLSTLLDRDVLIQTVADEVQSAFNYYHVHVYLYDEAGERLLLAGGTGDIAKVMMGRDHQVKMGHGLVGTAAAKRQFVLATDVRQNLNWLPNPLLPETQSEVAVPIILGGRVLGVLDVQHNVVNGLTEQDVTLLQSITNQIAIVLNNAQLYQQAQNVAQREALINHISQQIQRAMTVEDVLQIATEELGQALGASQTAVYLRSDNGDRFTNSR